MRVVERAMSIPVLIVTHPEVGPSVLRAAQRIVPAPFHPAYTFEVAWERSLDAQQQRLEQRVRELDQGEGVLVLVDVLGATPSNLTLGLERELPLRRIGGLNLPMLLKVLTSPADNLDELAAAAREGARLGSQLDA
jgi:PTS system ascorbate-specific IIA component